MGRHSVEILSRISLVYDQNWSLSAPLDIVHDKRDQKSGEMASTIIKLGLRSYPWGQRQTLGGGRDAPLAEFRNGRFSTWRGYTGINNRWSAARGKKNGTDAKIWHSFRDIDGMDTITLFISEVLQVSEGTQKEKQLTRREFAPEQANHPTVGKSPILYAIQDPSTRKIRKYSWSDWPEYMAYYRRSCLFHYVLAYCAWNPILHRWSPGWEKVSSCTVTLVLLESFGQPCVHYSSWISSWSSAGYENLSPKAAMSDSVRWNAPETKFGYQ